MNLDQIRPFGCPARIVMTAGAAFVVTAAIVLAQLYIRNDAFMPDQLRIFYFLYLIVDYPAALLSLALLAIGLIPALQRGGLTLMAAIGQRPLLTASVTFVGLAAGSLWIYHAHPLSMDEYAAYLQGEILASGRLTGEFPRGLVDWLVVPGFQKVFLQVSHANGSVASVYLPGFALLLAPFSALNLPWLANPVIGALSVLVVHQLALELVGSRLAAGGAVLVSLASPAFTINAISFYSMPAHLLCNAVFALLLLRPTALRALGAGLIGGLALNLHNPVPHALFALPWLGWILFRRDRWSLAALIASGYLPGLFVMFGWQQLLASMVTASGAGATQPSVSVGGALLAKLQKVLILPSPALLAVRMIGLSKLWVWAAPAVVVAAAAGLWKHRSNVGFQLLAWSALLTFVGFLFVPFDQGHGWGFRYFHSVWFVLPVFAAAAFVPAPETTERADRPGVTDIARYVAATSLASGLVLTSYFAWNVEDFVSRQLAQLPRAPTGTAVVEIIDPTWGYYAADLVQNDPFLRGPVVRMITHGPDADRVVVERYFPGLVLLSSDFRGQVWGHPQPAPERRAAATD